MKEITVFEGGKRPADHAGDMCEDIKAAVYAYSDKVPLATAIGVLEIAKREILEESRQS